jgi:predicted PurR-regulated permease PerM
MFVIIAFAVYSIFPVLIEEGKKFFPVVGSTASDINVENFFNGDNIDPKLTEWLNSLIGDVGRNISEFGASILNTIIQNIPAVSTSAILFVITAAYFATIMPVLRENLWRLFPKSTRERSIHFFRECYRDIEHYIRGQVILALIVGVMVGIGTSLSGVPYSLFLGFLSGIFDFIPFLGPILVSIPGMLLGFLYGGVPGLIKMLIVFLFANQLESWVLQPRIQGTRMKVNWFAILLAILIAGSIFGLPGVLIGIPFLAFFKRFWVEYVQEGFEKM